MYVVFENKRKDLHESGALHGVSRGVSFRMNGKWFMWIILSDNWWFDDEKEAWHISTSAFLKEEIRKSRLVARVLPKFGPPFTTGAIGGGSSASATAILRFVSPQCQTTRKNVQ